jgi:GntR family transcriptional regulator / MocR family aminotransferase
MIEGSSRPVDRRGAVAATPLLSGRDETEGGQLVSPIGAILALARFGRSAFDQLAFANFLHRGDFDRHLRRMRQLYRARRDLVVSLLGDLLPHRRVRGIAAGLHVVLEMPSPTAATAVQAEAEEAGIVLETLEQHAFADYAGPAGLLVGYGGLPEPSLEAAIRGLAKLVRPESR